MSDPTFTPPKEPVLKIGAVTLSSSTVLSAFAYFNIPVSDNLKLIIVAAIFIATHAAGLWAARAKVFSPATVSNALDDLRQVVLKGAGDVPVFTPAPVTPAPTDPEAQPLTAPAPETPTEG